ncbi:MAG TPA: molybdopterin cofactor-binding domain-containing protein, partial [Acidobacteriota bacterium]|nr:molybdopterin cofactor-binding domain-containing protein [Acidobacteriota bacterium]
LYQNTIYQGGKYCDWGLRRAALITPLLSRRTGRPVRMLNSRQNMYDLSSPQRYCNVKLGFNNDGIITAVHSNIVGDAGIRGTATFFTTLDLNWNPFYTTKCLNLKTECETVFTNTGRAYTSGQQFPFNWDELTVAIARISEKLGIDPVEIATRNIHGPSSQTDPTIPPSFQLCIDHGRKKADWKWHPAGTKKLPDGRMHGMAFRYQMCKRHANMTYQCTVAIKSDGRVYIPTRGPWGGIFGADVAAMVVAEEIGARMEDVILLYDPRGIFTPLGGGSDGSAASSWVAKEAAIACKKLLLERAAEQLRVDINDLDTGDTMVFLKSAPEKKYPFAQFAERDKDKEVAATYSGRPPIGIWNIHRGKMLDTLHTTFCEVAVDTETGEVEVLRFVVAIDPGKILRATSLESQIDQNMMIGVGSQLYEEFVFDRQTGVKLSTNMIEYKKPTILDMPPVDSVLLETRAGNGCYGANGVSHSLASTQLILCAVANAIGKWAITPPITPDKVLKALGKA